MKNSNKTQQQLIEEDAVEKFEHQYATRWQCLSKSLKVVKHFYATVYDFHHHYYDDQQIILLLIFKAIAMILSFYNFNLID